MNGHQHIGGRNIRLINTTAGARDAVVCESVPTYGTQRGVVGNEKGFIVKISHCEFDPPLRLAAGQSYVLRSEYGADMDNFAPAAFPPPYQGVMGYMSMIFTLSEDTELGVFSMSGTRTMASERTALMAAGGGGNTGFCVVRPPTAPAAVNDTSDTPDELPQGMPLSIASERGGAANTAAAVTFTSVAPVALEIEGGGSGDDGGFVQLTPEHNFTMQWAFVDGGKNVAFKLRLETATWMSIGIHRPGGRGMPAADMIVVQSRDEGASFLVMEQWTMAYDNPRPKRFYGSTATSGLSAGDCAVSVSSAGVIEASFKRSAILTDPGDQLGANITKGVATVVVWAFGDEGAGLSQDYHGQHKGTSMVTW
jgi:hypothetical protein